MRKTQKKRRQNGFKIQYKINRKSTSEKRRENDAKLFEKCFHKKSPNRQKSYKTEVQKSIEKTVLKKRS